VGLSHLVLGKISKAWGLKGELKVQSCADSIVMAAGLSTVCLKGAGSDLVEYTVEQVRQAGSVWILRLQGVQTIEQAERLVGCELLLPRSAAPILPEGTYYQADLIGLRVEDEAGQPLGRVAAIENFGAGDLLRLRLETGAEEYLPFTKAVVPTIEISQGRMVIRMPATVLVENGKEEDEAR